MDKTPFVSIIIPCRNEGRFIGKVLENILSQDYPASHLEVLIADGRVKTIPDSRWKDLHDAIPSFICWIILHA